MTEIGRPDQRIISADRHKTSGLLFAVLFFEVYYIFEVLFSVRYRLKIILSNTGLAGAGQGVK